MIAHYIVSYLKSLMSGKEEINLFLPLTIALGIISSALCEGLFAYYVFLIFKDLYEYTTLIAVISTAGFFCLQAILLFYYSYYLHQKKSNFKKVTNAFVEGFQNGAQ